MAGAERSPFVFVPEGAPVPDAVRGPEWVRIPATFVPRGAGRLTPGGQPWPRDRAGRDWPKDRFGRPICPLTEMAPGVRAPGEGAPGGGDPLAAYLAMGAVFRDPAGLTQLVASGGSGSASGPSSASDSGFMGTTNPPSTNPLPSVGQSGGTQAGNASWTPKAGSDYLNDPSNGWLGTTSKGLCAPAVRQALEHSGVDTNGHPYFAGTYGPFLASKVSAQPGARTEAPCRVNLIAS